VQALDAIVVETPASGETRRDELERIRRYAGLTS
jgi:hypothetical protein